MTCDELREFLAKMNKNQEKVAIIDVRPKVQYEIVNTNESKVISEKIKSVNIELGLIEKYIRGQ